RIVETGPPREVLRDPQHPYTRALIAAAPTLRSAARTAPPRARTDGDPPAPLVVAEHLVKDFRVPRAVAGSGTFRAVDDVSFVVPRGQTLALVGESGSGKSTTARLVLRLMEPTSGSVTIDGVDVTALPPARLRRLRRRMQV